MNTLTVVLSNPRGETYSVGPLTQFLFVDRTLRETPDGPVLATDVNFRWQTGGGAFSRFDCDTRCHALLAKKSGEEIRYGPYRGFSSLNGLKFTDHQIFCIYDEETRDWYGYESGQHWDTLRVIPAG